MALVKCKECGGDVSTEAATCPHCGYQFSVNRFNIDETGTSQNELSSKESTVKEKKKGLNRRVWFLLTVIAVIGFFIFVYYIGKQTASNQIKIYSTGDEVRVGDLSYTVSEAWWSNHLISSNQLLDEKPDAMFLMVYVMVFSYLKDNMTVDFTLVDENGTEYEECDKTKSRKIEGSFRSKGELYPYESLRGILLFDVPQDHTYYLKINRYVDGSKALIKLEPK